MHTSGALCETVLHAFSLSPVLHGMPVVGVCFVIEI